MGNLFVAMRRWRLVVLVLVVFAPVAPSARAQTPMPQTPVPQQPSSPTAGAPISNPPSPLGNTSQQQQSPGPAPSSQFIGSSGLTVERLVETGFTSRSDLLAARQRLAIAQGRLVQAGLRPNPALEAEYGSARFLAGEPESALDIGVSQVFELGGKRRKRVAVARLELLRARAEVLALERRFAAEIRASYARAVAAGKQLDVLDQLIGINEELVRVTKERLKEGDVAPFEVSLVELETARLRAQVVRIRAELEGELISLRALAGLDVIAPLLIAPLPERPPRLDLSVMELTDLALRERPDLQAARLGEELGTARIHLAEAQAVPNVAASVRFTQERSLIDAEGIGELRDKDNVLTFGVSIEIPVFNRNQGEIIAAAGERVEAQRQREFLEATIRRDVALAYRRYRAAAEALVLYSTQIVPRAEDIVRSVRAAYGLGEFSIFDVLNEQRRLVESETGYNEALRDYYTALAELEGALGAPLPASGFAPQPTSVLPDETPLRDPKELRRSMQLSDSTGAPRFAPSKNPRLAPSSTSSAPPVGTLPTTDTLKTGTKSETEKGKDQ